MPDEYMQRLRSYAQNEKIKPGERTTNFFGHDVRVKPFRSLDDLERADIVGLIFYKGDSWIGNVGTRHTVIFDRFDKEKFVFVEPIHHNEYAFAEYKLARENVHDETPYNSGKIETQLVFVYDRTKRYPIGVLPPMLINPSAPMEPRIYERYCDSQEADRVYKGRYSEMERLLDEAIAKWGIPFEKSEAQKQIDKKVEELKRKNLAAMVTGEN